MVHRENYARVDRHRPARNASQPGISAFALGRTISLYITVAGVGPDQLEHNRSDDLRRSVVRSRTKLLVTIQPLNGSAMERQDLSSRF